MSILKENYGITPEGVEVSLFTFTNKNNIKIKITNFGGIIISVFVPDKNGKIDDIILGYDTLERNLDQEGSLGALIGRFANRIDNGTFKLGNNVYKLPQNDGTNCLHGGITGFNKVVWDAEVVTEDEQEFLLLSYLSKDGEEGFPGNLDVKVRYSLSDENELRIDYFAVTDKETIVNLTNHAYFNLSGHASGSILNHELLIKASKFTPVNEKLIPTGELADVKDTPMDFTSSTQIGKRINDDYEQLEIAGGYDHNWIFDQNNSKSERVIELYDPKSERVLEVYTSKPGVQFYSGNFLDGVRVHKDGAIYNKQNGLCLETQYFPDAINHPNFPSPILRHGEEYRHFTIYKFLTK